MTSALKKAVCFADNTEKKQRNPIPFLGITSTRATDILSFAPQDFMARLG